MYDPLNTTQTVAANDLRSGDFIVGVGKIVRVTRISADKATTNPPPRFEKIPNRSAPATVFARIIQREADETYHQEPGRVIITLQLGGKRTFNTDAEVRIMIRHAVAA